MMVNSLSDVMVKVLLANGCLNQEQFRSTYMPIVRSSGLVGIGPLGCVSEAFGCAIVCVASPAL